MNQEIRRTLIPHNRYGRHIILNIYIYKSNGTHEATLVSDKKNPENKCAKHGKVRSRP